MLQNLVWPEIWQATWETLYMTGLSVIFTTIIGLPLGILLVITGPKGLIQNQAVYQMLSVIVNILRSIPFVILLILMIPVTEVLVGQAIGVQAAIPPLVVAAAPFYARLVETSIREVDFGMIEAAQSMGANIRQIIFKVLLPEAKAGIIAGLTITTISLISYSAISGVIGGGGLGDLAIRYGYQRFELNVMLIATAILVIIVQILQMIGDRVVIRVSRRK
ncbi:ABC transporter permease [Fodinisporobacter ferrooxydans]|uniref:ABC transporter permease n=1 Tax=Fodinisporobacter ferrooxydans TaxID=2901836 RepID=A0ABY4CXU0_9BACL|nr:ABC transporter permease [Alicyclobacillaceae bacterium MYW30-H2]